MKKSFLKTLSQSMVEFFKVLWNFFKNFIRKIIKTKIYIKISQ